MGKQTVEQYFDFLASKGFRLGEDARNFIRFGQQYTGANDWLTIMALEWTLKIQKHFDGSFYLSLLEELTQRQTITREQVLMFMKEKGFVGR
ncbi:DUF6123 family protein [Thermaerobacillus caldiproteolyticus]|uniref:Uncharacterized protein n=1 Tax=Thermaerobacillus caldiproteolyticus TaxID=247480 RepID=A0A7W0C071_9BACL|nr:DUF6123 family protein [Anoxybacillus caldiproteolyticus]MBA2876415.1 hypothetical protein [Anoxybacillus caldiproteolyticus]QPA32187.1 hypothetical protein ISX45_04145 [Anoxybacillus caldiproteolyticus]